MLVASTLASLLVTMNVCLRLSSRSFKRDTVGGAGSFGNFWTRGVALRSNKDSVLKREQVNESVLLYENLFRGARKMIGSLHKEESIKQREREHESMINSFYNLVTDFYEFGWGQVSLEETRMRERAMVLSSLASFVRSRFQQGIA